MDRPYRILLASRNPDDQNIELPVFIALKKLGYEVITCDATYKPFGSRLLFRIGRRLFKTRSSYLWNKLLDFSSWFTQRRVLNMAKSFRPDFFIAIKAKEVTAKTVRKLHDMNIVTANWYMESLWHQSIFILAPAYDHFFIMDDYTVSELHKKGMMHVHYLPFGTRLDQSQVDNTLERTYGISFIGTPIPIREQIFGMLSDLDVNIWGPQALWEKTALMKFYRGKVFGPELDNVYQRTKIVINTNSSFDKQTGPSLRNFEVMGNGALLICDYAPGLAEVFADKKEIVFYRDIKEIPDLVSYYLKNEGERAAIAMAGQAVVLSEHTIESRVKNMMGVIKSSSK